MNAAFTAALMLREQPRKCGFYFGVIHHEICQACISKVQQKWSILVFEPQYAISPGNLLFRNTLMTVIMVWNCALFQSRYAPTKSYFTLDAIAVWNNCLCKHIIS